MHILSLVRACINLGWRIDFGKGLRRLSMKVIYSVDGCQVASILNVIYIQDNSKLVNNDYLWTILSEGVGL